MKVEFWEGGLQAQEVSAIKEIQKAFSDKIPIGSKSSLGGSLQDQLREVGLANNGMFPWKGYAGFRFVSSRGSEGEFDLVIVTHCSVIIVELKDFNYQPVTARGDNWYKGNQNIGRSPVSVTRNKKFTLDNKLKKISHRLTNKGFSPIVEFFVVMTGNADFSHLSENQLHHTLSLEDFLKFADRDKFQKRFRPHPKAQVLNRDFHIFDELFLGNQTKPKAFRFGVMKLKKKFLSTPRKSKGILARSEISKNAEALLRVWNFNNLEGDKSLSRPF